MSFLKHKRIAILGGTGTLGRALVTEIAESHSQVEKVLIFSRDEIKQLKMMEDFPEDSFPFLDYKLGDVRDLDRLNEVLLGVNYVVHAAAIKHVVMAEQNPSECYKTNILGSRNIIEVCDQLKIERALLVSTDKAINPIGVYGKSKKLAEEDWTGANNDKGCRFCIIRLGNIIGSRGSVFEAFANQRKNGILKVTHPEATRFCISQRDASGHILHLLEFPIEGIFTPKMDRISILELAKEIGPECEIEFIGLREGDKLHEEIG